ncbi:hypothetical protein TNCV_2237371 [Trichonephila clavipes]|nr:hypothetical protein TNCV_2237371 [Trichonephila clavipes]
MTVLLENKVPVLLAKSVCGLCPLLRTRTFGTFSLVLLDFFSNHQRKIEKSLKNSINLKYEAISVPQDSVRIVKKTQERKSSTCYLLITKGVTSSRAVPLKTRRVGERCMLNLSRAQTSSCWSGVVVKRGQHKYRPR